MGAYHPECPERLAAIGDHMIAQGLDHFFAFHEAPRATYAQLMRVHTVAHLEYLKNLSPEHGIVHIDPDTAMNPYTLQAALRAAGAVRVFDHMADLPALLAQTLAAAQAPQ